MSDLSKYRGALSGLTPTRSVQDILNGVYPKPEALSLDDKTLIIMLDHSGSMADVLGQQTKIVVAWTILQQELLPRLTGWKFGILRFSGERTTEWLIPPGQSPKALALITAPTPTGNTPIQHALQKAWAWALANTKQARFILLSDGVPTDESPEQIILGAVAHGTIPSDTVGLGTTQCHGYDEKFLRQLSAVTGGLFCAANSVRTLTDIIIKLSPAQRPLLGPVK